MYVCGFYDYFGEAMDLKFTVEWQWIALGIRLLVLSGADFFFKVIIALGNCHFLVKYPKKNDCRMEEHIYNMKSYGIEQQKTTQQHST